MIFSCSRATILSTLLAMVGEMVCGDFLVSLVGWNGVESGMGRVGGDVGDEAGA